MKHLLISREYPPASYPTGGIGTYARVIAGLLTKHGETVHVIAERLPRAQHAVEKSLDGLLIIHRVPMEPGPSTRSNREARRLFASDSPPQAFAWKAGLLAERLVDEEGIDLIEAQEWEAPLCQFQLRRANGLGPKDKPPCLIHLHSPTEMIAAANGWDLARPDYAMVARLEEYSITAADGWVCPSQYLAQAASARYGLPQSDVAVIPYPLEPSQSMVRPAAVWRNGTILFVGRIEPRKGVQEWVEAAIAVADRYPQTRFEFAGPDSSFSAGTSMIQGLRSAIPERLENRFTFHGEVSSARIADLRSQARIAVVPSRWDNFPYACMEAMSSGLPVISTHQGGMAAMVEDGVTGWLAASATPGDLAHCLERALDCGPSELADMGDRAAQAIAAQCDPDRVAKAHLDLRRRLAVARERPDTAVPRPTIGQPTKGFISPHHLSGLHAVLSIPPRQQLAALAKAMRNSKTTLERIIANRARTLTSVRESSRQAAADRYEVAPTKRRPLAGMAAYGEPGVVSVVLIFLNGERFLPEAVDSILAQTYQDFELLLIDDGSSEPATEIARSYLERFPEKVRYLEHEGHANRGMSASRNLGIRHSRGEFIAMMDADDIWLPHKLTRQVEIMRDHPEVGMVYGATPFWYSWTGDPADAARDFTPNPGAEQDAAYPPSSLSGHVYPFGNGTTPFQCDTIIRREAIFRIGGFEEDFTGMFEDTAFYHKVFLSEAVFVSGECWDRYRVHPGSINAQARRLQTFDAEELRFLQWMENYLVRAEIDDVGLHEALGSSIAACRRRIAGSPWGLHLSEGSRAQLSVGEAPLHQARVDISQAGTGVSQDVQLNFIHPQVLAGQRYKVCFDVSADRPRVALAGVAGYGDSWDGLGWYQEIGLTAQWTRVEAEFVATSDAEPAQIHFDLGLDHGSVEVKGVQFVEIDG